MALRRRQKRTEESKIDATPPWEVRQRDEPEATVGPFDVRDAPDDEVPRVDLGGLRVPAVGGLEMRLDVNEAQQVMSVTLVNSNGYMQLGVFAAPRNEGIWDEVRTEIAASLAEQGGSAKEKSDGPFGAELIGRIRGDNGLAPVRFIGVEGPRWFLRAMIVGAAAADAAKSTPFERALREVVVVRGTDPLPVRDPVPLTLPNQTLPGAADDSDGAGDHTDSDTDSDTDSEAAADSA